MKLIAWTCILLAGLTAATVDTAAEENPNVVRIERVEVAMVETGPVVILRAEGRAIPVFVDITVAESIHAALSGGKPRRPFPHDLMHTVLTAYDGRVTRAAISLKGNTFHADLTVVMRGREQVFDSRASDAIALATHFKAPVTVSRELLEKSGVEVDAPGQKRL
ncbi:MAG: bifunctional nuclease family protein [Betaproteobacteria bacterium]|nr:bifunctional nuclease family protein [Betaproteobacteria bacterium]